MSTTPASPSIEIPTDRWTKNSIIVLLVCTACWAFDVYETTAFSLATPAIMADFQISRTDIAILPVISRWVGLLGSVVGMMFADKYGRRMALSVFVLGYSLLSGITGLTVNWIQMAVTKSLTTIPLGLQPVAGIMAMESTPTKWRGTGQGFYVSGYPFGFMLASLISIWVIPHLGWRPMYAIGILPALMVFVVLRNIKESPRFHLVQEQKRREGKKTGIGVMTVIRRYPKEVLLALWLQFLFGFPWGGWSAWFPTYLNVDMKLGQATSSTYAAIWMALAIFAYWLCGFICDKVGRKRGVSLFTIPGGIFLLIYGNFHDPVGIFVIGTLLNFCIIGPFGPGFQYYLELFPTEVRASAQAAIGIFGFLSSFAALVVASAATLGDGFRILGVLELLIAPSFILLARETLGKELINRVGQRAGDAINIQEEVAEAEGAEG